MPPGCTSWNSHRAPSAVSAFANVAAIAIRPAARGRASVETPGVTGPEILQKLRDHVLEVVRPVRLGHERLELLAERLDVGLGPHELLVDRLEHLAEHFAALRFVQRDHLSIPHRPPPPLGATTLAASPYASTPLHSRGTACGPNSSSIRSFALRNASATSAPAASRL